MQMLSAIIAERMAGLSKLPNDVDVDESAEFQFVLINCAGVNDIDWLENFTPKQWDRVMNTNAKGIYMVTRAFLGILKSTKGTLVNVVSNAAHIPMTCSLAYNASKGAAHIMTLQLARELTKKYGISVFGIAPNRMKGTQMSADIDRMVTATRGWTEEYAQEYQRNGLLTGEETDPAMVAQILTYLLDVKERHHFLSGCILPMGA
jgi:NAD(P)-dependent dehydrogenase (short-subunit alcohol dehydrogenase family)